MKDDFWVEETSGKPFICGKRKRRVGKRTIEFVGWGSRPLIEFLEVIGQDTKEKHSRHAVAGFIAKYINEKGLFSAEKKKKVFCDDILFALFGKKSVSRIKVYDMLEEHFAENHGDSDDELLDSSDDDDYREKSSVALKNNPTGQIKKVPKKPKSCFAAIIPENIKLIYLKKSLVKELLKFPESFESKVIGSFVRMKSDPNDIFQKNPFQLQLVSGLEKVSGDAGTEIHLKVSNFFRDIPIDMLSEDNFSEEEVEDVRNRIKAGSLNRLSVDELQLKAQVLHADITKHWIAKEIILLNRRIEHASEKGWQRLKFEYLERKKTLQTPSEQEKLLHKVPEVIAEELEPEGMIAVASGEEEVSLFSPKSILRGSSDVSSLDASGSGEIIAPPQVIFGDSHALLQNGYIDVNVPANDPKGSGEITAPPQVIFGDSHALLQNGCSDVNVPANDPKGDEAAEIVGKETLIANVTYDKNNEERRPANSVENGPQAQEKPKKLPTTISVIDLSDDDSENEVPKTEGGRTGETVNDSIWFYLDPQGIVRGPFSLHKLKQWNDLNYFHPGFIVWKIGQTTNDGVLLAQVLRQNFPN